MSNKISEKFMKWIHAKYEKKGVEWTQSDEVLWKFWCIVFPLIIWIPILFWLLKLLFIDYMLKKYGFNVTIIYLAIIMMVKPIIMDVITKIMKIKE